jgi:transcription-repair coupling factor (superfamily II helicase)
MFTGARWFPQQDAASIPVPKPHGETLPDDALIQWVESILTAVYGATTPAEAPAV